MHASTTIRIDRYIYTHTRVHRHTHRVLYRPYFYFLMGAHISLSLSFFLNIFLFPLCCCESLAVSFFIYFPVFSFYKLITRGLSGGEREGGRKGNIISNEEFRHELAIIALSVYFVPGPFSLSPLCLSVCCCCCCFCCSSSISLSRSLCKSIFIYLAHSQQLTLVSMTCNYCRGPITPCCCRALAGE